MKLPLVLVTLDASEQTVAPSRPATPARASSDVDIFSENDGLTRVKGDLNRCSVKVLPRPDNLACRK